MAVDRLMELTNMKKLILLSVLFCSTAMAQIYIGNPYTFKGNLTGTASAVAPSNFLAQVQLTGVVTNNSTNITLNTPIFVGTATGSISGNAATATAATNAQYAITASQLIMGGSNLVSWSSVTNISFGYDTNHLYFQSTDGTVTNIIPVGHSTIFGWGINTYTNCQGEGVRVTSSAVVTNASGIIGIWNKSTALLYFQTYGTTNIITGAGGVLRTNVYTVFGTNSLVTNVVFNVSYHGAVDTPLTVSNFPIATVSAQGIANGVSTVANAGMMFGPDTLGTKTCGIQEAINSQVTNGWFGGKVLLGPGTFYISDRIYFNGSYIFEGAGEGSTISVDTNVSSAYS